LFLFWRKNKSFLVQIGIAIWMSQTLRINSSRLIKSSSINDSIYLRFTSVRVSLFWIKYWHNASANPFNSASSSTLHEVMRIFLYFLMYVTVSSGISCSREGSFTYFRVISYSFKHVETNGWKWKGEILDIYRTYVSVICPRAFFKLSRSWSDITYSLSPK